MYYTFHTTDFLGRVVQKNLSLFLVIILNKTSVLRLDFMRLLSIIYVLEVKGKRQNTNSSTVYLVSMQDIM